MKAADEKLIRDVLAEAEAYNRNMEEGGYHTGGPCDIEGVYDSRVHLLTCAIRALLQEGEKVRELALKWCADANEARDLAATATLAKHRDDYTTTLENLRSFARAVLDVIGYGA